MPIDDPVRTRHALYQELCQVCVEQQTWVGQQVFQEQQPLAITQVFLDLRSMDRGVRTLASRFIGLLAHNHEWNQQQLLRHCTFGKTVGWIHFFSHDGESLLEDKDIEQHFVTQTSAFQHQLQHQCVIERKVPTPPVLVACDFPTTLTSNDANDDNELNIWTLSQSIPKPPESFEHRMPLPDPATQAIGFVLMTSLLQELIAATRGQVGRDSLARISTGLTPSEQRSVHQMRVVFEEISPTFTTSSVTSLASELFPKDFHAFPNWQSHFRKPQKLRTFQSACIAYLHFEQCSHVLTRDFMNFLRQVFHKSVVVLNTSEKSCTSEQPGCWSTEFFRACQEAVGPFIPYQEGMQVLVSLWKPLFCRAGSTSTEVSTPLGPTTKTGFLSPRGFLLTWPHFIAALRLHYLAELQSPASSCRHRESQQSPWASLDLKSIELELTSSQYRLAMFDIQPQVDRTSLRRNELLFHYQTLLRQWYQYWQTHDGQDKTHMTAPSRLLAVNREIQRYFASPTRKPTPPPRGQKTQFPVTQLSARARGVFYGNVSSSTMKIKRQQQHAASPVVVHYQSTPHHVHHRIQKLVSDESREWEHIQELSRAFKSKILDNHRQARDAAQSRLEDDELMVEHVTMAHFSFVLTPVEIRTILLEVAKRHGHGWFKHEIIQEFMAMFHDEPYVTWSTFLLWWQEHHHPASLESTSIFRESKKHLELS